MQLSKAENSTNSIIQVQSEAPVGLLLGTNVLSRLGFAVLQSDREGVTVDLLSGRKWQKEAPTVTQNGRQVFMEPNPSNDNLTKRAFPGQ